LRAPGRRTKENRQRRGTQHSREEVIPSDFSQHLNVLGPNLPDGHVPKRHLGMLSDKKWRAKNAYVLRREPDRYGSRQWNGGGSWSFYSWVVPLNGL
jgi:hypothetical protein